jgi:hypothetical protein
MLHVDTLTFQEFAMGEVLPLSVVQAAVLEFLRDRDDVILFGAQAVNAYVAEPRMSQDIDLLSPRAAELAVELRDELAARFHISVRIRHVGDGRGVRLYQVQKAGNRHLVDVRTVDALPASRRIAGVQVAAPEELIAQKVIALHRRRGQPKAGTDWRDVAMLLLAFPELKTDPGPVSDCLRAAGADEALMAEWRWVVAQPIDPDEDEGF